MSNHISKPRICWEFLRAFDSSFDWKHEKTSKSLKDWIISRDSPKSYDMGSSQRLPMGIQMWIMV